MTDRINLAQLAQRESEQIEWKENVADVNDVVATLVAFANDLQNLGGGYVVCGAHEDKDNYGFPRLVRTGLTASRLKEVEGQVLNRCRTFVSPAITPLVDELEADDPGRRILVFTQPATGSAHTFRRGDEGAKHFIRVSRSTLEARNGLLKDLLVRKGALEPWDRRPCSKATVNDIDLLALRDALQRMGVFTSDRGIEPYLTGDVQLSPFVPSLCVAEPMTGILRPRNFAVLLFGGEPQRFIPGAFSIFSAYPGLDRTSNTAQRIEIPGTVLDQARRLQELLGAEAVTLFDKTHLESPNAEKYPRRAIQEALINALAHRDYELFDPGRFTTYRDRIEFISPGSLPLGVSLEQLRTGQVTPRWRNQTLAWFLSRLQLAQAEGQGIQTIRSTMLAGGSPLPIFEANEVAVTCVLPAHPRFEATTLNHLGGVHYAQGEMVKALEYYEKALPLRRTGGDRSGEAATLNNMGLVYSAMGQHTQALEYYGQALPLYRAVGESSGEATTLNNMGMVYSALGEKVKALEYYRQALPLLHVVGNRSGEATTLNNMGMVYSDLGEKGKALEYFGQALPLLHAVGNRSVEATTLSNIGHVYDALGEKAKALEYCERALPLFRAVGDRSGEATTLNNMGSVYNDMGEKGKALEYYGQALPLLRAVGNRSVEATSLNNMGSVYDALGEKAKALEYYGDALSLRHAVGDRSGEATTLNNMGGVYSTLGETGKALESYGQALTLYRAVGDPYGLLLTQTNLAALMMKIDPHQHRDEAQKLLTQALETAQRVQSPRADWIRSWQRRFGFIS